MLNNVCNSIEKFLPAVSRVKKFDAGVSKIIADEIKEANLDWKNFSYSEYVSEGVHSLSLYSSNGDSSNTLIKDCTPEPTDVLAKLPKTAKIIEDLGLDLMWVRLNLLRPGACLWEHRDYSELEDKKRLRLHLPVQTNDEAFLILEGRKVHMHEDALWKLNPADYIHGAVNNGSDRIHIVFDCYVNENLENMVRQEVLDEAWIRDMQTPTDDDLNTKLVSALRLYQQDRKKEAEETLLRSFYNYDFTGKSSLDLVREMYYLMGDKDQVGVWENRITRFLKQESFEFLTPAN